MRVHEKMQAGARLRERMRARQTATDCDRAWVENARIIARVKWTFEMIQRRSRSFRTVHRQLENADITAGVRRRFRDDIAIGLGFFQDRHQRSGHIYVVVREASFLSVDEGFCSILSAQGVHSCLISVFAAFATAL